MAKPITQFFESIKRAINVPKKFLASHNAGQRILPSRTPQNDTDMQLRIDAGEVVDGKKRLCLQVNKEAKAPALKRWLSKKGSHSSLAKADFDMKALDSDAETARVLEELETAAKENIKEG